MKKVVEVGTYLVADARVCHGQLTFKGTRVPVQTVLNRLGQGRTIEELRLSWPEVPREAIVEAVQLATAALREPPDQKLGGPWIDGKDPANWNASAGGQ